MSARKSIWSDLQDFVFTVIEGILFTVTPHTIFMLLLTSLTTLICAKGILDFSFDTSMSIVAVGTVFPLVFSVQASFQRRERALGALASLKGTIFAVFLMFKGWDKQGCSKRVADIQNLFNKLIDDILTYLRSSPSPEAAHVVYDGFATLASRIHEFGPDIGYSKAGEGGMSRMQQYLRDIMSDFENIRTVRDTQTPLGLRVFCFALIHISPILLSPYWNHFCRKQTHSEIPADYGCEAGYFVGSFYVLINFTLYRVQTELEDPFDGNGRDDIKWEFWRAQLDQMNNFGPDGPEKRSCPTEDNLYQKILGST